MNFDPKAIRRALMIAKDLAVKIDPGFAVHNLPMPQQGVPLERAKGGPIKTIEGADRERNLAAFMRDAHREMFDSPGKPKVFYHGTSKDFSKFGSKLNFVSQSPEFVNSFLDLERHGEKEQRVLPVHVNIKNPFDFENKSHMEALKEKIPHVLKTLDDYDREKFDEGHWAMMEMPEVVKAIKQLGHDGMYVSEYDPEGGDDFKNLAVFNPAQIKSAVGNVGTFDPSNPDITKAEGGPIKTVEGVDRERNLAAFMRGAHPDVFDKNGRPKVFYHGTIQPDIRKFESGEFSDESSRKNIAGHFALAPDLANHFAEQWQKFVEYDNNGQPIIPNDPRGAVVYPAHLNIKNIFDPRNEKHLEKVGLVGKNLTNWEELEKNLHRIKNAGFDSYYDWEDPRRSEPTGIAVFDPKNIKSAVGNVGTFDPTDPDITKAEGGAVDDLLPPRNLNPMGMYSAAAEAARAIPQERGTPQQMLATMKGVKPDELRWSGVQNKFANQKTVTRDELAQHFENQLPPIEESQTTKYSQYTEPGGQNYREVLLHMPPDLAAQAYGEQEIQPFKSSHWEEPNVLAHVRLKDRELPSTKKPPKPDQRVNVRQRHSDTEGFFPSTEVDAWSTKVPGLVVTRSIEPDEKNAFTVTHVGTGLAAARDLPYHKAQASAEALGKIWDGWDKDDQTVKDWANANATLARQTLSQVENPAAKKVLHIEELQSDWAQQGRDKGFRDNAAHSQARKNYQDLENQLREMTKAKYMKMANDLQPGQELPFELKHNILSKDYKDFETFVNYLEKEQRTYYRNEDGTPSKKTNYAKFDVEELPLEDDQRGIFLKNRFTGNFFNEDLLNPNDLQALAIARRAHKNIQNFENRIKNDPNYSNQVFDQYVSRMFAPAMAEEHGPEWVLKTAKANDEVVKTRSGASEAPYVTNTNQWTDLALKRALTEAARGNYHHLMWTPGVAQADRYQLNKFVDALRYKKFDDGYYHISAEKNGRTIHAEKYKPEELPGVVGQEMAKKIISGEGESTKETEDGAKVIKGLDLNVGGRGMYEYYDKILPRRLMELVKEHDPSVVIQPSKTKGKTKGFPSIQITPKLRDSILRRGFKAFKRGGAVQAHLFPHYDEPKSVEVPVMDHEKTIRRALMIAKAEGGPIGGTQSTKGLPFPEEETAFRLRTKLNREAKVAAGKADPGLPSNPRMVIRAPKAKEGETQLPNFIVGPLTHKDWIARHEKILSPEEIQHSSQWYKNIYGNFLQYTNNNESEAKKLMRAWLVAQQNVSPAGAMQNVLLQREQMQRGVPEPLWRAGGMPNPTNAARSVLKDQPISGGVGQKISDFVDSAEGLDTRSYLGHDPRGGSPFVIDVHSARDAGLVDPALINHLKNLGYNENDLAKVQTDFEASPSDAQYENRAQWGRDLTKYLNKIGWQGKKDWRPEEIQAVGWMGMTKLTRNAEEDSASGLGRNLRRVSFELSPGEGSPWAQKYGTAFESLPDEERYGITQKMSNRAMQIASELSGVNPLGTVHGTGAWMQYQNPAAVGQALATQGGADIMANTIGHLLHQTEVWHNRVKPITSSPKGFAVDFIESGSQNLADRGQLRDFWQKITDADKTGLIQGYQPITLPNGQVGVRALVDKGGLGTHKKLTETLQEGGDLDKMLKELPFDVESQIAEAEITKARNDWKENPNGQAYLQRLSDLMGSDPSARLSAYGSQLEKELEGHLDEAYARQGRSWRATTPQGQQAQVKALETPPLPTMAYGGAIDKALQIALRART